jgi:hypothetical protein
LKSLLAQAGIKESPMKLPEKLKQIRERTRLTPDDFASNVNAKNGNEFITDEKALEICHSEDLLSDNRDLRSGDLYEL